MVSIDRKSSKIDNMKKRLVAIILIMIMGMISLCGCEGKSDRELTEELSGENPDEELIVVGFSQIGAESDWRWANSESMKSVFVPENGYKLIFEDAQQKQTNQIMAIRSFIQQEVDYIVLAPVTETGWDTVLREAKDAGIPVIVVDRMVDVDDSSLFNCFVGSDFELEAKKACSWLEEYLTSVKMDASEIHIADIQGTIGASAQIGRSQGLYTACEDNGWNLAAVEPGEFTESKGYEAASSILEKHKNINVFYCENDNSAFGAIEAIEDAGYNVGLDIQNGDIMVISFDGVNEEALQDVIDGKIACIAECNPMHGPRVEALIQQLENGQHPDKLSFVDEDFFSSYDKINSVIANGKGYPVTILK